MDRPRLCVTQAWERGCRRQAPRRLVSRRRHRAPRGGRRRDRGRRRGRHDRSRSWPDAPGRRGRQRRGIGDDGTSWRPGSPRPAPASLERLYQDALLPRGQVGSGAVSGCRARRTASTPIRYPSKHLGAHGPSRQRGQPAGPQARDCRSARENGSTSACPLRAHRKRCPRYQRGPIVPFRRLRTIGEASDSRASWSVGRTRSRGAVQTWIRTPSLYLPLLTRDN